MTREEVLEQWRNLSQRLKKNQEFLKYLATNSFEETPLSIFPLGIDSCRQNLDSWNSPNYQIKLSQHKSVFIEQQNQLESSGTISEHLSFLAMSYTDKINMFNDLTSGWKKEKDSCPRYQNVNNEWQRKFNLLKKEVNRGTLQVIGDDNANLKVMNRRFDDLRSLVNGFATDNKK